MKHSLRSIQLYSRQKASISYFTWPMLAVWRLWFHNVLLFTILSPLSLNPASHCGGIQKHWCHKPVTGRLAVGYGGQFQLSGRPHNPTSQFRPSPASVITAKSFWNGSGLPQCVPPEMGFHWERTMWLWWNPNDVTFYRQLLSIDQVRRRTTTSTWSRWGGRQLADNIMTLTPSIQQQQLKIETRDFQLSIEISQQANHFSRYSVAVQDRA